MKLRRSRTWTLLLPSIVPLLVNGARADAAYTSIHGGPTYAAGAGGYLAFPYTQNVDVNDSGIAVASVRRLDGFGRTLGSRAVRWDGSGAPAVELQHLGTDPEGYTQSIGIAINASGVIAGRVLTYSASGQYAGELPVVWGDPPGAPATLERLAPPGGHAGTSWIWDLNDAGIAVGFSSRPQITGTYWGWRPVMWDTATGAITELGISQLGASNGGNSAEVRGINEAGLAVGYGEKYTSAGENKGARAVRWEPGAEEAVELGHLGTDPSGFTKSGALAVNAAGTAIGTAFRHGDTGLYLGYRAVRWDAGGIAATELGHLGTASNGYVLSQPTAISDGGTIVGWLQDYDDGQQVALRAVQWKPGQTAASELASVLTPGPDQSLVSEARDINASGLIVGFERTQDLVDGFIRDARAMLWFPDGSALDLNLLVDPSLGWKLLSADAISDQGWVAGVGKFDPDGIGGQAPYDRLFLLRVPEPAGTTWIVSAALILARRRGGRAVQRRCRPTSSTSKTSVAFGGIFGGRPSAP